jgi:chromosome segregation ATPase
MTPEQFRQVLASAGRLDPERMDRDQLLAEVRRLQVKLTEVEAAAQEKATAIVEICAGAERLLRRAERAEAEVKRLTAALDHTEAVTRATKEHFTRRTETLLNRAVRAEEERDVVRAERDRFRDLVERALSIREHGEEGRTIQDGRFQWPTWDRDAETALRAAMGQEEPR